MKKEMVFSLVVGVSLLFGMNAYAADYPTKPITLQIPYPPGGSTDVGARIVAAIAEKQIGQPIVVVNKAGAGGQVGWTELARQKPDGYYLGRHQPAPSSQQLSWTRSAKPSSRRKISSLSSARPSIPPRSPSGRTAPGRRLKDLIEECKKKPGQITAGIVGYLQDDEIGYLQFAEAAGVTMRLVYFDGAAPAITALLGKHVDVLFCTVGDNFTQWKAGRIRMLTIMDKERTKFYPDLPTTAELGFPTIHFRRHPGIAAPKGVPEPIMKKLQDVFKKAMMTKEHSKNWKVRGSLLKSWWARSSQDYYWESFKVAKKWVDYVRKK